MNKQSYNNQTLRRYLLGSLPEAQTEAFDELSITDDKFAEALDAAEKDLVDAYVQDELSGAELEQFELHYLASPSGSEKLGFARAFRVLGEKKARERQAEVFTEERSSKTTTSSAWSIFTTPRLALQWGFAATALVFLIAGGWLVFENARLRQQMSQTRLEPPVGTSETKTEVTPLGENTATPTPSSTPLLKDAAPVIAQLNDGGRQVTLDQEGKLSGVDWLPPAYQPMLKEALATQRLEKSSQLAGLARPGSSLMSTDDQGNQFSVIEPIGKVILSDRPTFRWSKLTGATGYVVEVYDEKFNLTAASPQGNFDSWTLPKPLKRGGVYSWQVKALKDSQEIKSPRPPAPQAKFRILDQAKTNELAQARSSYANSRLLIALLCARAGLLDEAEQELFALQKQNPDSMIISRLLASVRPTRP